MGIGLACKKDNNDKLVKKLIKENLLIKTYINETNIQHLSIAGSTGPRGSRGTNELSDSNSVRKHLVIQVFSDTSLKITSERKTPFRKYEKDNLRALRLQLQQKTFGHSSFLSFVSE